MSHYPKIALIGTGYWGKNLARNFSELQSLCCVHDIKADLATLFAKEYNIPTLSWNQILQDKGIDAVVIATPAVTHHKLAKEALEAGKHAFVEKPITLNLAQAEELHALSKLKQRKLMVGHLLQYHPLFIKLKELIKKGIIGELQYIYSNRLDLGKIYTKKDALWNLAPHDLSMILSITQSDPSAVQAVASCNLKKDVADFATIHLKFSNNLKAHIFISWLNPLKEHKLTIIGTKGMFVFDDTQTDWTKKLALYSHTIDMQDEDIITTKVLPKFIETKKAEPLKNECMHFIDCVRNDKTPYTDGQEALGVIRVLDKARAFIDKNQDLDNHFKCCNNTPY